ncbi:MAG TPA: glycerol-3-phosphate 1-O-acyltransferase PlsY [Thermoanaerobaculia bacterium]|nr:glycerol-3-phosphate 1-O-acyltransferase PlsY [Thermoanaerobaculia bacterium]
MSAWTGLVIVAGAYALGSVPFSYLIVKLAKGRDVRTVGSGNAGATNVMRAAGKAAGAAALLLDCGKGVAAVAAARALGAPGLVVGGAAAAVVAGHVFPVFLGFRGGKGVATAAGALGALEPAVMAACVVLFILVVAWKRTISLGSIAAASAFPLLLLAGSWLGWLRPPGAGPIAAAFLIVALVVVRHAANLDRLRRGVEPRLGARRLPPPSPSPSSPSPSPPPPPPPAEERGR